MGCIIIEKCGVILRSYKEISLHEISGNDAYNGISICLER